MSRRPGLSHKTRLRHPHHNRDPGDGTPSLVKLKKPDGSVLTATVISSPPCNIDAILTFPSSLLTSFKTTLTIDIVPYPSSLEVVCCPNENPSVLNITDGTKTLTFNWREQLYGPGSEYGGSAFKIDFAGIVCASQVEAFCLGGEGFSSIFYGMIHTPYGVSIQFDVHQCNPFLMIDYHIKDCHIEVTR